MANGQSGAYLPGDPRYGLGPEELAAYYRDKPAQWAIFCWDRGGTLEARGTHLQDQRLYVGTFGERVIGYGHLVSDNGLDTLGTTFFMQLDDRAAVDQFLADEPLNRAGVYDRIDIRRWSNSFQKRQADYQRKGMQQFLCTGSKIADTAAMFAAHRNDHESYFEQYDDSFVFRGPILSPDGNDNIGTALLVELFGRAAAEEFWNNEPYVANGGYQDDSRIYRWVFGD
jgi:uncharacterized protein YciI